MVFSMYDAYVLVDTGTMDACISKELMLACGLFPKVVNDYVMFVNTTLDGSSILNQICRNIDVVIDDIHMPIDMLVQCIIDFDVILGINWLNKY